MKRNIPAVLIICIGILLTSCEFFQPNELSKPNATAGFNGSFEITESGYPVNWAFGPNPERDALYEVSIDTTYAVEGNNALMLIIKQGGRVVGVRSIAVPVQHDKHYKARLWAINDGCSFTVNRIMTDASGKTHKQPKTIVETSTLSDQWQQYQEIFSIAENEANVFLIFLIDGPCTFWTDDVKIEKVTP